MIPAPVTPGPVTAPVTPAPGTAPLTPARGGADRPLLAVLMDYGAASPFGIVSAARGLCRVVFVCDRSLEYVREQWDTMAGLADICDVTGLGPDGTARAVAALRPDAVHTFADSRLRLTAIAADRAGVLGHSPDTVAAITDKYAQRRALADAGVQTIVFQAVGSEADLESALDAVGLPAVLKPCHGVASLNTAVVVSRDEARHYWRLFHDGTRDLDGRYLLEQFLQGDVTVAGEEWGDYVSVESVVHGDRIQHTGVVGRLKMWPPLNEGGVFLPSTLDDAWDAAVRDCAAAAISAVGIRFGGVHTEIKLTAHGPEVLEVNGRTGGHVSDLIMRSTGFDQIRAALRTVLGRPPQIPPLTHRRCAYHYFLAPPHQARRLVRLDGAEEVERLPGVARFEHQAQAGDALHWRRGTRNHIGVICGTAADHAELLRVLATIDDTVRPVYRADGHDPLPGRHSALTHSR